jgi:PAS domain S-box-containing protein
VRYGFAVVSVAAATGAAWVLERFGLEHPPAPFLAAILLCGWFAGTGPVVVAVVLSTLAFKFFFLSPLHTFALDPASAPYVWVFLLFALLAAWFSAARQRAERLLREAREELEDRVAARTEELQERTAQLDELFAQAPEAIALLDTDGATIRVNNEFTRLFGYTAEEATGRLVNELLAPQELREEANQLMHRLASRGERIQAETIRRSKDGRRVPVSLLGTPIIASGRLVAHYVMYRDITEHARLESELRRSEAYLVAGQRLSHTGSWAWDVRSGRLTWAEETFRIFGLDPKATRLSREALTRLGHPDDRARADLTFDNAAREKRGFEISYRIVRPDGATRYVQSLGQPVFDEAGEVVEFIGVVMDVTERKRAERALRRARERALEARFVAILDERTRLAREIHDTLLQGFTGVALKLVAATSRVIGPPETTASLRDVVSLAQRTLEDARRAVWDMRSPSLSGGDFAATLRAAAEDGVRGTELRLEYAVRGTPQPLDPDAEAVVFRVVQEAIANVVKHADARAVGVGLTYELRGVRLSVTDDGRGFAVDPDFRAYGGHWGLLGMRERASQIRARLAVRSAPGQGTEILLLVPHRGRGPSHQAGSHPTA